jgi:DNA-binding MarR family transcriptional regulator
MTAPSGDQVSAAVIAGPGAVRAAQADLDLGALTEHIGYVVRRAQLAIFADFIRTLAPVDIRPAQYSVLIVIGANPGLTQAKLGRALAIKRANLVGMLDELERRKLARRVPSPKDGRSHALFLTANGRQMLARFRRLALEHESRACAALDEREKRTLLELLGRVARSLA